jgi:hypothetical protein
MYKPLLGCSVLIMTIAAAPAPAAPRSDGNHAAPTIGAQVVSNGSAIAPVAGGQTQATSDKKICRQLPSSYSRMTKRVCLTAGQWAQVEGDGQ